MTGNKRGNYDQKADEWVNMVRFNSRATEHDKAAASFILNNMDRPPQEPKPMGFKLVKNKDQLQHNDMIFDNCGDFGFFKRGVTADYFRVEGAASMTNKYGPWVVVGNLDYLRKESMIFRKEQDGQ